MSDHYHLVGIGGIGMSALAEWLLVDGHNVSGSDLTSTQLTKGLESKGASIFYEHRAENIVPGAQVVYSSGVPKDNVELQSAIKQGAELLHRSDLICRLVQHSPLLVVTGAHGKTSTTAMLAEVLDKAGSAPSFLLGGISNYFGVNGKRGKGDLVVLEGDESDGSFLNCSPTGAIVTNFDREHLSFWKTEEALLEGFIQFAAKVRDKDLFFFCGDDPILSSAYHEGFSYGFSSHNDLVLSNVKQEGWNLTFDICFKGKTYDQILLNHIGEHQALNAAAVFGLALQLGLDEQAIRLALATFKGVKRRVDLKGKKGDVLFLDDYGHHPTEIAATIKGLKKAFPSRRLIVAFQPHRYTRTLECLSCFGSAFDGADLLLLSDIYSAGEPAIPGITGESILQEIKKSSKVLVHYVARDQMKKMLDSLVCPNDICISMGAGDITHLFSE